ncbi:6-carboxytetrahydropterin synthase [Pyruvatibacter sp.]|uniref:6-pyruvoyl trahydropterin synthase family protein n=1 Tax=Pyruvatibacter sp. TaxID=1981328 RepID=UPI0032EB184B
MRITKQFSFDAAHFLPHAEDGHPNRRLHGHSFRVIVALDGMPDATTGLIRDFGDVEKVLGEVRGELDHHFLNEIEGLEAPTLENITLWLWARLAPPLPELARIEIHRDSCGESCIYEGSRHR